MEYKGYNIVNDGTFGMKFIKTIGRGSLPLELRSDFSNYRLAMQAIDVALSKKENKDGEVVFSN